MVDFLTCPATLLHTRGHFTLGEEKGFRRNLRDSWHFTHSGERSWLRPRDYIDFTMHSGVCGQPPGSSGRRSRWARAVGRKAGRQGLTERGRARVGSLEAGRRGLTKLWRVRQGLTERGRARVDLGCWEPTHSKVKLYLFEALDRGHDSAVESGGSRSGEPFAMAEPEAEKEGGIHDLARGHCHFDGAGQLGEDSSLHGVHSLRRLLSQEVPAGGGRYRAAGPVHGHHGRLTKVPRSRVHPGVGREERLRCAVL